MSNKKSGFAAKAGAATGLAWVALALISRLLSRDFDESALNQIRLQQELAGTNVTKIELMILDEDGALVLNMFTDGNNPNPFSKISMWDGDGDVTNQVVVINGEVVQSSPESLIKLSDTYTNPNNNQYTSIFSTDAARRVLLSQLNDSSTIVSFESIFLTNDGEESDLFQTSIHFQISEIGTESQVVKPLGIFIGNPGLLSVGMGEPDSWFISDNSDLLTSGLIKVSPGEWAYSYAQIVPFVKGKQVIDSLGIPELWDLSRQLEKELNNSLTEVSNEFLETEGIERLFETE